MTFGIEHTFNIIIAWENAHFYISAWINPFSIVMYGGIIYLAYKLFKFAKKELTSKSIN